MLPFSFSFTTIIQLFFDNMDQTNKGMTNLVNEISIFIEAYGSEQDNKQELRSFSYF